MTTNLSYVSCPLPDDLRRLIDYGDTERARRLIERRIGEPALPECMKDRLRFELLILDRLPLDYPLTEEEAYQQLREEIRGFTREEMEELRDDGIMAWAYRDGKVYYHEDAVDSVYESCPQFNERRVHQEAVERSRRSAERLDTMIRRLKAGEEVAARFRLRTELTIKAEPGREGKKVRVHMPIPVDGTQSVPEQILLMPPGYLAPPTHPQRTAYFEGEYRPGMTFVTDVQYTTRAKYVEPRPEAVLGEQPAFDTEELLPQISFTPFIRQLTAELAGDEKNPLLAARRFYDYVTTRTRYRYVSPYFMYDCIPEFFGAGQRGDCGMYSLLFITLCRCWGIPAQWQSGFYTRPDHAGMHDWARFYIAPYGWLFADGSFGAAAYETGHLDRWNFYFGNLEPWRLVCNSAIQQELDPPRTFLRYDPYDSQAGEVEFEDRPARRFEYTSSRKILSYEETWTRG